MSELIVALAIIIAVIAVIWYLRSSRAQTAVTPKRDESRGMQGNVGTADGAGRAAATLPVAAPSRATSVAEMTDEPATDRLEAPPATVTLARHDAERVASRLSGGGETALAIQTAAAYGGAFPADGRSECPPSYPIKVNAQSLRCREPSAPTYRATIAAYCFSSIEAA